MRTLDHGSSETALRWMRFLAVTLTAALLIPAGMVGAVRDECGDDPDAGPGNGQGNTPLPPKADCTGGLGGSDVGDAYQVAVPAFCKAVDDDIIPDTCYVDVGVENGRARDIHVKACKLSGSPDHWHLEVQWYPDFGNARSWIPDRSGDCMELNKHFDNTPPKEATGRYFIAVEADGRMDYRLQVDIVH